MRRFWILTRSSRVTRTGTMRVSGRRRTRKQRAGRRWRISRRTRRQSRGSWARSAVRMTYRLRSRPFYRIFTHLRTKKTGTRMQPDPRRRGSSFIMAGRSLSAIMGRIRPAGSCAMPSIWSVSISSVPRTKMSLAIPLPTNAQAIRQWSSSRRRIRKQGRSWTKSAMMRRSRILPMIRIRTRGGRALSARAQRATF